MVGGAAPPGRYRITLALVGFFEHVPHLIRAILCSFQISYFTDVFFLLFFQSLCSHAEGTMKFSRPFAWDPSSYCLFCDPLILFSKVSSASLISHSGSFAQPVVMGCTVIALLSRSTLTHEPQWIPLLCPGLEEPPE